MMAIAISIPGEPKICLRTGAKKNMGPVALVVVSESKELKGGPVLLPLGKAISSTLEHLQVSLQCLESCNHSPDQSSVLLPSQLGWPGRLDRCLQTPMLGPCPSSPTPVIGKIYLRIQSLQAP